MRHRAPLCQLDTQLIQRNSSRNVVRRMYNITDLANMYLSGGIGHSVVHGGQESRFEFVIAIPICWELLNIFELLYARNYITTL
jgi:hypothetical protein